jgi:hypothetical protein
MLCPMGTHHRRARGSRIYVQMRPGGLGNAYFRKRRLSACTAATLKTWAMGTIILMELVVEIANHAYSGDIQGHRSESHPGSEQLSLVVSRSFNRCGSNFPA